MGCLSGWCSSWWVTRPMPMPIIIFGLGTSTHVCSWSITDRYIIKWDVSHAWYWLWTIKVLVEAVVLWWLYINLWWHSSSIDHCQTISVFIIRLVKKLLLKQKCFIDTSCVCTSPMASKKSHHRTIGKNPFLEKNAYWLVMYTSAS